jgi:hypothetical protein
MTSDAAERVRKMRERRKEGIRVLRVEVQIETVETLVEHDYLSVEDTRNLDAVQAALSQFINDYASAVTSNSILLDTW